MTDFFYDIAHYFAENACGNGLLEGAKNILTGTGIDSVTGIMQSGYNIMIGISAALITLYFLMDLIEQIQRGQGQTPELLLRSFLKVVIAVELIIHGFDLFITLRQVGDSLTSSLTSVTSIASGGMNVADQIVPTGEKWYTYLGLVFQLILPFAFSKIIYLGINVTCYARIIELVVRTVFAPVAIADIFHDGMHSPGVRYIKKYIAVCLQGAVIICILAITSTISASALSGMAGNDNFIWATLAINFSALMAILKSQGLANDVAGA